MPRLLQHAFVVVLVAAAIVGSGPAASHGVKAVWLRGIAARYNPGVMEMVARNRGMAMEACAVASSIYELGTWVQVRSFVTGKVRTCRVLDVSAPQDIRRHRANQMWIELDYHSARALCGALGSPRECPILVRRK